jgi:hypothetical protein
LADYEQRIGKESLKTSVP